MPHLLAGFAVALLVAACTGATETPSPVAPPTSRPTASLSTATSSATPATAEPAASVTASPIDPFPHLSRSLEEMLPAVVGNVELTKLSMSLSTYMANSSGGDKTILLPWLIHFGRTAEETPIAIGADLTRNENFLIQAIQVPGAKPDALVAELSAQATKAGWPQSTRSILNRSVLQVADPKVQAAGGIGTAFVVAKGDVMFVIVTDDPTLLVEALIRLPS